MWSDSFKLSCTEKTQRLRSLNTKSENIPMEAHHGFADNKSSFVYQKAHPFPYHSLDPCPASGDLGGRNRTARGQGPDQWDGYGCQRGRHSWRTGCRQEQTDEPL